MLQQTSVTHYAKVLVQTGGEHTVAATHEDLEPLAFRISRAAKLAEVGGLTGVHGRTEESAAYDDAGIGVRTGGTGSDDRVALEVYVDFRTD